MCNKLAVDAVKLLCCSTSICEQCKFSAFCSLLERLLTLHIGSHDIPETCSICTHSPTSPDDCTPDKKLRNTVRAFIRTEERKRGRPAEQAAAPAVQAPTPVPAPSETPAPDRSHEEAHTLPAVESDHQFEDPAEPVEATAGAPADVRCDPHLCEK